MSVKVTLITVPAGVMDTGHYATVPCRKQDASVNKFNPLTSSDPYRSRTAPLTSKVAFYIFIQQI